MTSEGPSLQAARRELAEAEAGDIENGQDSALDAEISPSVLIALGLDLENEQ